MKNYYNKSKNTLKRYKGCSLNFKNTKILFKQCNKKQERLKLTRHKQVQLQCKVLTTLILKQELLKCLVRQPLAILIQTKM